MAEPRYDGFKGRKWFNPTALHDLKKSTKEVEALIAKKRSKQGPEKEDKYAPFLLEIHTTIQLIEQLNQKISEQGAYITGKNGKPRVKKGTFIQELNFIPELNEQTMTELEQKLIRSIEGIRDISNHLFKDKQRKGKPIIDHMLAIPEVLLSKQCKLQKATYTAETLLHAYRENHKASAEKEKKSAKSASEFKGTWFDEEYIAQIRKYTNELKVLVSKKKGSKDGEPNKYQKQTDGIEVIVSQLEQLNIEIKQNGPFSGGKPQLKIKQREHEKEFTGELDLIQRLDQSNIYGLMSGMNSLLDDIVANSNNLFKKNPGKQIIDNLKTLTLQLIPRHGVKSNDVLVRFLFEDYTQSHTAVPEDEYEDSAVSHASSITVSSKSSKTSPSESKRSEQSDEEEEEEEEDEEDEDDWVEDPDGALHNQLFQRKSAESRDKKISEVAAPHALPSSLPKPVQSLIEQNIGVARLQFSQEQSAALEKQKQELEKKYQEELRIKDEALRLKEVEKENLLAEKKLELEKQAHLLEEKAQERLRDEQLKAARDIEHRLKEQKEAAERREKEILEKSIAEQDVLKREKEKVEEELRVRRLEAKRQESTQNVEHKDQPALFLTEVPQLDRKESKDQNYQDHKDGVISGLRLEVATLKGQVGIKDNQIRQQQAQISSLTLQLGVEQAKKTPPNPFWDYLAITLFLVGVILLATGFASLLGAAFFGASLGAAGGWTCVGFGGAGALFGAGRGTQKLFACCFGSDAENNEPIIQAPASPTNSSRMASAVTSTKSPSRTTASPPSPGSESKDQKHEAKSQKKSLQRSLSTDNLRGLQKFTSFAPDPKFLKEHKSQTSSLSRTAQPV